jgi:hypothetical protein
MLFVKGKFSEKQGSGLPKYNGYAAKIFAVEVSLLHRF